MLGLGILWISQIPFGLAEIWWARRHDAPTMSGTSSGSSAYWLGLAGEFAFICLALVIVMGFAQVLRERWWVAGAPTFVAIYVLFAFSLPWLVLDDRPVRDPALATAAREYAREEGTEPIPVRVEEVSELHGLAERVCRRGWTRHARSSSGTRSSTGASPTTRCASSSRTRSRTTRASTSGRAIGWYALFAVPGTFLIALATRRRGSLAEAQAVPLALFVFVALSVAAQPSDERVSPADGGRGGLGRARDDGGPGRREGRCSATSREFAHADPSPPEWATLLFDNHPTMLDRIRMAEAWRARSEGRSHP